MKTPPRTVKIQDSIKRHWNDLQALYFYIVAHIVAPILASILLLFSIICTILGVFLISNLISFGLPMATAIIIGSILLGVGSLGFGLAALVFTAIMTKIVINRINKKKVLSKKITEDKISTKKPPQQKQTKESREEIYKKLCKLLIGLGSSSFFSLAQSQEEVKKLLEENSWLDVTVMSYLNSSALHLACHADNVEILQYLIDKKKDLNFEIRDKQGYTPFLYACARGNIKIVKFLAEKTEVNYTAVDEKGRNALHIASDLGCLSKETAKKPAFLQVVQFLLIKMPPEVVRAADNSGQTALDIARNKEANEIVQCLEEYLEKEEKSAERPPPGYQVRK